MGTCDQNTVGLRPHRDSGFVLKAEKFDEKTVIHDYGFGGAGMSLAWGCGAMAAGLAFGAQRAQGSRAGMRVAWLDGGVGTVMARVEMRPECKARQRRRAFGVHPALRPGLVSRFARAVFFNP